MATTRSRTRNRAGAAGALAVLNVALLAGIVALVTSSRAAPRQRVPADAFRFPTSDSHAAIDLSDESLAAWSRTLDTTRTELVRAMDVVGRSEHAVREYLARHA